MTGGVCFALDPLPSEMTGGREVHRHCLLEVGHDGFHQSRDGHGVPVHEWRWKHNPEYPVLLTQPSLFDWEVTGG